MGLAQPTPSFYSTSKYITEKPQHSSIKRSPQKPYSGGTLEDFIDWLRMNTDANWPSYVDDDYWLILFDQYDDTGEYEAYAEQYFISRGQTPPWKAPIGDAEILLLFCAMLFIIKYLHNKKSSLSEIDIFFI